MDLKSRNKSNFDKFVDLVWEGVQRGNSDVYGDAGHSETVVLSSTTIMKEGRMK